MRKKLQVNETNKYLSTKKRFKHNKELLLKVEEAKELFLNDRKTVSLSFKKINCKKDKDRYSIRIPGTQYRILMTLFDDEAYFLCICNHDKYDFYNKNC